MNNNIIILWIFIIITVLLCDGKTLNNDENDEKNSLIVLKQNLQTSEQEKIAVSGALTIIAIGLQVFSYLQRGNNFLERNAADTQLRYRRQELSKNLRRWQRDLDYVYGSYQLSCSERANMAALERKFSKYPQALIKDIFHNVCGSIAKNIVQIAIPTVVLNILGIASAIKSTVDIIQRQSRHRRQMKSIRDEEREVMIQNNNLATDVVDVFYDFKQNARKYNVRISRNVQNIVGHYIKADRAMSELQNTKRNNRRNEFQKQREDRQNFRKEGFDSPLARRFHRHRQEYKENDRRHQLQNQVKGIFQGEWDRKPKELSWYQKFNRALLY